MRKELNKSRYILAAILTFVVFVSGLSVGLVVEKARLISSEEHSLQQRVDLTSMQVQQLFLDTHDITSCGATQGLLKSNMESLDRSMRNLIVYDKRAVVNKENFELNLRNYYIAELQYYLIAEKMQKLCDTNTVNILYFYQDGDGSDTQGYILDFVKEKFGEDVLVFTFNAGFYKEPMIDMLVKSYGLKQFPSIILDGEIYEGFTTEETIVTKVCEKINNQSPYCL